MSVFDKLDVVSHVVKAMDEVRRKEARGDAQAREQLERTNWLWRKNPETWTAKEGDRGTELKDKPLVTGLAYAMRLELQKAYATTVGQARNRFETWCRWARTEAEALSQGAEMVERHLEGILALAARADDRLHGRTQQLVLSYQM